MCSPNLLWCVFGLATIAIGNGVFLPSIAPLIGQLYDGEKNRDTGFTLYYLGKNAGIFFGAIICGFVGAHFGYRFAFLASSAAMLSGLIVFIKGRKNLPACQSILKRIPKKKHRLNLALVYTGMFLGIPVLQYVLGAHIENILLLAGAVFAGSMLTYLFFKHHELKINHMGLIIILLALLISFVMFLNLGGSTLNLFIERIVNRQLFGHMIPTGVFYALDPVFMMIIGVMLIYFGNRVQIKTSSTQTTLLKIGIGFVVFAFSFFIFVLAAYQGKIFGQASLFFIVAAYALFPLSELLVVVPILSTLTQLAPKSFKNAVVGIFMFAQSIGAYLSGKIAEFGNITFDYSSPAGREHASVIYEHVFISISLTLLLISAMVLLLFFIKKSRLMEEKIDENTCH